MTKGDQQCQFFFLSARCEVDAHLSMALMVPHILNSDEKGSCKHGGGVQPGSPNPRQHCDPFSEQNVQNTVFLELFSGHRKNAYPFFRLSDKWLISMPIFRTIEI